MNATCPAFLPFRSAWPFCPNQVSGILLKPDFSFIMKKREEALKLHIRPRETDTVSIEIPRDTLESLRKVAASRDMSYQAVLKFYIG